MNLARLHEELCESARTIIEAKNNDYRGGTDDPFANFRGSIVFNIHPIIGILLRIQDKLMRIKTFAEKGELKVKSENVDDALMDVINYIILIKGLLRENEGDITTLQK